MSNPKVFIFAEPDQAGDSNKKLEKYGLDLSKGDADWHTPQGNNEEEMIGMARDAEALLGTSIRSSPITRPLSPASASRNCKPSPGSWPSRRRPRPVAAHCSPRGVT